VFRRVRDIHPHGFAALHFDYNAAVLGRLERTGEAGGNAGWLRFLKKQGGCKKDGVKSVHSSFFPFAFDFDAPPVPCFRTSGFGISRLPLSFATSASEIGPSMYTMVSSRRSAEIMATPPDLPASSDFRKISESSPSS